MRVVTGLLANLVHISPHSLLLAIRSWQSALANVAGKDHVCVLEETRIMTGSFESRFSADEIARIRKLAADEEGLGARLIGLLKRKPALGSRP